MRRNKLWQVIMAVIFCAGLCITFFTAKDAETSAADNLYTLSFNDKSSSFNKEDLEYLQEQGYFFTFAAEKNLEATNELKKAQVELISTNSNYAAMHKLSGTFFNTAHEDKPVEVAALNTAAAQYFFGNTGCAGESISVNGINYTIVGVVEDGDERRLYIPKDGNENNIFEIIVALSGSAYAAPLIKGLGYTSDEIQVFNLPQYIAVMWQRYSLLIFLGGVYVIIRILSELRKSAVLLRQEASEHFNHNYLHDGISANTWRYTLPLIWQLFSGVVLVLLIAYAICFTPCLPDNFFSMSMNYTSISGLVEFFMQEQATASFMYLNSSNLISNLCFFLSLTTGVMVLFTADA